MSDQENIKKKGKKRASLTCNDGDNCQRVFLLPPTGGNQLNEKNKDNQSEGFHKLLDEGNSLSKFLKSLSGKEFFDFNSFEIYFDKFLYYNKEIMQKLDLSFALDFLDGRIKDLSDQCEIVFVKFLNSLYNDFSCKKIDIKILHSFTSESSSIKSILESIKYLSASIIFHSLHFLTITIKTSTTFKLFKFSDFSNIFDFTFNGEKYRDIFFKFYSYMERDFPIFLGQQSRLFNILLYHLIVLRYIKKYSIILSKFFPSKVDLIKLNDLYDELLIDFNVQKDSKRSFTRFYNKIPVKDPRFIASVIYSNFLRNSLNTKEISKLLHLSRRQVSENSAFFYKNRTLEKYLKDFQIFWRKCGIKYSPALSPSNIFIDLDFNTLLSKLKDYYCPTSPLYIFSVLSFISHYDYCLKNNKKIPKKRSFSDNHFKSLKYKSFINVFTVISNILLKENFNKYQCLLPLIQPSSLDEEFYKKSVIFCIDLFLKDLEELKISELGEMKKNKERIVEEFLRLYELHGSVYFYSKLHRSKSTAHLACALIFHYFNDIRKNKLSLSFFSSLLINYKSFKSFGINYNSLLNTNKSLTQNFYPHLKRQQYNNQIKSIKFNHHGIIYYFKMMEDRLKRINNNISDALLSHLSTVTGDRFPDYLFEMNDYRCSNFQFSGSTIEPIFLKDIQEFFDDKIKIHNKEYFLSKMSSVKFSNFQKEKNKNPNHKPILDDIINREEDCVAIEVPVWKEFNLGCLIGHIDLIIVRDNSVFVCDYKRSFNEIYRSIPQIVLYSSLLRSHLLKYSSFKDFIIKGVGFCNEGAIEFDLTIIPRIKDFLNVYNDHRSSKILTLSKKDFEILIHAFLE